MTISDFFAEYLNFVFAIGFQISKSSVGTSPGPRAGAEAGERREKSKDTHQKSPRYSAKSTLSVKNNVAMHMISTFMTE